LFYNLKLVRSVALQRHYCSERTLLTAIISNAHFTRGSAVATTRR